LRLIRLFFVFIVAAFAALAQTTDTSSSSSSSSSQTGQTQDTAPGANQSGTTSSAGQALKIPQIQNRPVTNLTPEELADQEKNLQKSGAQLPAAVRREPDLEFQDFVFVSLGTRLPIFGYDLFENVPSTFAPLDRVQVPGDYTLGPGDELTIRAWGQLDLAVQAIVDRGGSIYIPKVGNLSIAGLKFDQLHDYLQSQIGRFYKNFDLSVSMGRLRSIQVFVVGQVKRPGSYTISSLSSLVDAIFASGGPSRRGSMRRIQLKRNGAVVGTFDLYDLLVRGDKSQDSNLRAGDVIYVAPVGPLVALAGSVNNPAVFELKDHTTLADAIAYAGGLATTADGSYAVVERIENHSLRKSDEFPLDASGLSRELHDGDIVRFQRILSRFENSITLRGNVARPGRYPWHTGMRVHDLIPERDFLVTEDYWKRQNQLAVNAQSRDFGVSQTELKNDVKRLTAEINWDYAAIQRFDPQVLSSHLLPFNLNRAIQGDPEQNLALEPGDVVTIFSQADIQVPIAEQAKFVHLEGEMNRAGVYQIEPGETLRHLLVRTGGITPQAYLFGSQFTRESARTDQQQRLDAYTNDLDRSVQTSAADSSQTGADKSVIAGQRTLVEKMRQVKATGRVVLEIRPNARDIDSMPDLALEDGDRLLIPFRPATVDVVGSVYNSGSFVFHPGKTVADYLRLAGGARRDGDKRHEFVLRADGSTVSKGQHNALLSRDFNTLRLMPGDTIVVPENLNAGAFLRNLANVSQILTGFGLAAGAIKVLFP
jgi:polysaccharide export outer membrane protein